MSTTFQQQFTFEERKQESDRIRQKYPDRVPVIVEKFQSSKVQLIDKKKYLIPCDLNCGQFLFVIRQRLKLNPDSALYIYVNGKIPSNSEPIQSVYEKFKNEDGFLYINYADELIFG